MRVETIRAIPLLAAIDPPQRIGRATFTKVGVTLVEVRSDTGLYIRLMLSRGAPLEGLYPMGPEMKRRFLEWRRNRGRGFVGP